MSTLTISSPKQQTRDWSEKRRWGARALFAVVDQGLISGSNFLVGIQLARSLHPADYGAYALAFSAFSLLLVLDLAIILEPMSVFGGSKYAGRLRQYLGQLLGFQTIVGGACLGALLVGAIALYAARPANELILALAGIAFATPFILLLYFSRRALYLEYRSNAAAAGAILYTVLLFSGLWFLSRIALLSPFTAFLDMGAAALATSALLLVWIRPVLKRTHRDQEFPIVKEHWRYGRWALGSSVFIWVSWNIWYTIVGAFAGLAGAGTLKALVNLAMPVLQSCAALSLLVLPHTARVVHAEGSAGARRQSISVASLFTAGAAIYWLGILAFRHRVITFLYAGKYADSASALPWLALASVATAATVGPVSALRALEKPSTVCVAFFISNLAGMAVGVPATRAYGVSGAVAGILLSSILALGVTAIAAARIAQSRNVTLQ